MSGRHQQHVCVQGLPEAGVPLHDHDGLCSQGARQGRGFGGEQEPAAQHLTITSFNQFHLESHSEVSIKQL